VVAESEVFALVSVVAEPEVVFVVEPEASQFEAFFVAEPEVFFVLEPGVSQLEAVFVAEPGVFEPGVFFVLEPEVSEPEVFFVPVVPATDVAESQASVDIAAAFDFLIPVSVVLVEADSSERPKFPAFPNVDHYASSSSSVEAVG
jgi:hypothetical protein